MKKQILIINEIITHEALNAAGKKTAKGNAYKEGFTRILVECTNFQRGEAPVGGLAKLRGMPESKVTCFFVLPTDAVAMLDLKEGEDLNSYEDVIGNEVSIAVKEITATQYEALEDKSDFTPRQRYADESRNPENMLPLTHGGEQVYWKREVIDGIAEQSLLTIDKTPVAEKVKA